MKRILFSAITVVIASAPAHADYGIYAKVGTLGAGGGLAAGLLDNVNVRAGFNTFKYSKDIEETDITYDGELDWQTGELLLDWHPFNGSFRITAGAYINRNEINVEGESTNGIFEIDGAEYLASEVGTLDGTVDFDSVSPYLGIGWGNALGQDGHFSFSADIGAMHQGSPQVSLQANCGAVVGAVRCAQLQNDIDAEIRQLESDIETFKWWPVLSVGVNYRF